MRTCSLVPGLFGDEASLHESFNIPWHSLILDTTPPPLLAEGGDTHVDTVSTNYL